MNLLEFQVITKMHAPTDMAKISAMPWNNIYEYRLLIYKPANRAKNKTTFKPILSSEVMGSGMSWRELAGANCSDVLLKASDVFFVITDKSPSYHSRRSGVKPLGEIY